MSDDLIKKRKYRPRDTHTEKMAIYKQRRVARNIAFPHTLQREQTPMAP